MAFAKGSLILVHYDGKAKGTDDVVETTRSSRPGSEPKPRLIAVGEGWVLRGLDEALAEMSLDEKRSIELPPDKTYGVRDTKKIRMIPMRKLGEDAEKVSVGDVIELDGREGIIRYIGSGRIQVDYNHRHAGKTIVYDMHVVRLLEADADKAGAIVERGMAEIGEGSESSLTGDTLEVMIPEKLFRVEGLQAAKQMIRRELFKLVPAIKRLRFIEEHLVAPPKEKMTRGEFIAKTSPPPAGSAAPKETPVTSRP